MMLNKIATRLNSVNLLSRLIICFVIIIVLPLTSVYLYSYNTIKNLMVYNTYNDNLKSLDIISKNLDSVFNDMAFACVYVNNDSMIKNFLMDKPDDLQSNNPEDKLKLLSNLNNLNRVFNNLVNTNLDYKLYFTLLDKNGIRFTNWEQSLFGETTYFDRYLKDFNESSYYIQWNNIEKNYVEAEKYSCPFVITLKKDLMAIGGRKKYGVFVVSIPEKEIRAVMLGNNNSNKRFIISKNTIISAYKDNYVGKNVRLIFRNKVLNNNGYFISQNDNGRKDLIVYNKVPNTEFYLVETKSYDMFIKPVTEQRDKLLLFYFICVLIFSLVAWGIIKGITRPLKELATEMKNIDIDNSVAVVNIKRNDEIGSLQKSFLRMKSDIRNLMHENIQKERKKRSAELELLQAQISPHFLFNTLNSIRWAAINNNNEKAANMVLSLVKLLRMIINKDGELITIENELDNVKNYIAILQMRHSLNINLVLDIDEAFKEYKIPRLLLQPIVENSIIHGADDERNEITIAIAIHNIKFECVISIEDNGKGFDSFMVNSSKSKDKKFSGIGLNNVNERIQLYFGEEYGLQINSEVNKGTKVIINLPSKQEGI